jgi:shikimate kinase
MSQDAPQPRIIVITGFMGAGKTKVARELARVLACDALDLDEFIETREGRSPRALIDEEGEAAFREIESRALTAALGSEDTRVIATGGGTWTLERNRAAIEAEQDCFTVWLDAPFELCWERIGSPSVGDDDRERPLARERERTHALYDERRALYGLADARVEVGAKDGARALAERILMLAKDYGELRKEKS